MLDIIRKKQDSPAIKIVFWAVIAAFVFGAYLLYTGSDQRNTGQRDQTAFVINGQSVPLSVFQNAYREIYGLYRTVYGDSFTPQLERQLNIKKQALDRAINETLLLEQATQQKLTIGKEELVKAIAAEPAFQVNGAFDKARYVEVLNYQRMTVKDFEAMMERRLLVGKISDSYQQGVEISDSDVEQAFRDENDKINLSYVQLVPGLFDDKVTVEPAKLEAFFAEQREQFRLSEKVAIDYVLFAPKAYTGDVGALSDEDLQRYYKRNADLFEIQEEVKASHLLVRVPPAAEDKVKSEKKALAEGYLAELRAGKDFAELARTKSDDPGSATKGGDLGSFVRGSMVPEFEAVAFALEPGQISDLVETQFGYHIIKVTEYIEGGAKPYAEVIDEVRSGLTAQLSEKIAFEKAMDSYNIHRKDGALDQIAKTNKLDIQNSGLLEASDAVKGLGRVATVNAAAFATSTGSLAKPIELPNAVLLFKVSERQESRLPELGEVKAQAEQAYRRHQAGALAKAKADALAKEMAGGITLADLATQNKLIVEETGQFSRSFGSFVPRLGNSEPLAQAAFELTTDKPALAKAFELNGQWIVGALKDKVPADMGQLDDQRRKGLRQRLENEKKQQQLEEKLKELRGKAEMLIDPQLQSYVEEG